MKAFLLALFCAIAQAQGAADCTATYTLVGNANTPSFDNRSTQCVAWRISYYRTGFSAATVTFQRASGRAAKHSRARCQ